MSGRTKTHLSLILPSVSETGSGQSHSKPSPPAAGMCATAFGGPWQRGGARPFLEPHVLAKRSFLLTC